MRRALFGGIELPACGLQSVPALCADWMESCWRGSARDVNAREGEPGKLRTREEKRRAEGEAEEGVGEEGVGVREEGEGGGGGGGGGEGEREERGGGG